MKLKLKYCMFKLQLHLVSRPGRNPAVFQNLVYTPYFLSNMRKLGETQRLLFHHFASNKNTEISKINQYWTCFMGEIKIFQWDLLPIQILQSDLTLLLVNYRSSYPLQFNILKYKKYMILNSNCSFKIISEDIANIFTTICLRDILRGFVGIDKQLFGYF